MSSLRAVHVLCLLCVCSFQNVISGPVEISGRYQQGNGFEQNDWRLILSSIESRLKSLDFLYTSQLTPTLEARLEHFQNRINGMEVKLLRVEALLTTKLDRMSDNISSRHFRDDMVQTDMFRKIETAYDGITHRLAYMDRKTETNFLKLQEKSAAFSKKFEIMNNALTDKYDSIESQLSDLVDGMEDMSTNLHKADIKASKYSEVPSNITQQRQFEMQDISRSSPSQDLIQEVKTICENSSENFKLFKEEFINFTQGNSTENSLSNFSDHFGNMLNEYAIKVSDLGAQVTKSDYKIATHLSTIEKVVNSSKAEMQNALRALMVQVGKLSPKDNVQYEVIDQKLLSDVAQKLDSNFEKVLTSQNTFLESCHRLQMDESQLEGQISDILNKLIDNFEGTTREHHHVLRKIEGLLVKHDLHTKKELHQGNTNIMTLYEQFKRDSKESKDHYKQTTDNLEALFALVQNILGNSSGVDKRSISQKRELFEYVQSLERALNFTKLQQLEMFDSYKATVETLLTLSQTKQEDIHSSITMMQNLTQTLSTLKNHFEDFSKNLDTNTTLKILNSIEKTYELVKENRENLKIIYDTTYSKNNETKGIPKYGKSISKNVNTTKTDDFTDLDALIKEIFFENKTDTIPSTTTIVPCLDVDIDVRFNMGDGSNTETSTNRCKNASTSKEDTAAPFEEPTENDTDCPDISVDSSFDQVQIGTDTKKPCRNKKQNKQRNYGGDYTETSTQESTTEKNLLIQNIIPYLITKNNAQNTNFNQQ